MDTLTEWAKSLPPLHDFLPPASPEAYIVLLSIFQYFPVVTTIQWLTPFFPQGKTSLPRSALNFPGRYAWVCMESIGALNLLYTLFTAPSNFPGHEDGISSSGHLPTWHKLVACLYILHYLNRAIITPLFLAPSMSPIHLIVTVSAMSFNYLNSTCLAGWLLGYGTPVLGSTAPLPPSPAKATTQTAAPTHHYSPTKYLPYIGLILFFIGMYGNIRAEGTLFRLRREEVDKKQHSKKNDDDAPPNNKNKYDKVYICPPPTGYFRSILYPHYVLEWLEWVGFLLIGFSITPAPSPSHPPSTFPSAATTSTLVLAPYYAPLANLLMEKWGLSFPLPAIAFCVNVVATTAARASWGRKWYVERFGEERVAGRGGFVPWCKWF
ncbi:hypothetical protein AJ79_07278 [Helicocarpus griseus UAMH5409]|uniref:Uncharacterized protein n=1 Tax=Helicocarpus griseus UAMH5409 TaxID=1447875 RepID=A0A2B7X4Y9_9EURO|nr:hypothetical protein AJ79_07278 [Helicocarpus griseus UAMH5409]